MSIAAPLRVAILTHSTNPRGGVVHALELGDALTRMGHEAVVHAPDAKGGGFFRDTLCATRCVPASPVDTDTTEMVKIRIADYVRHFENPAHRAFDVFHAQDGISGNALATLKENGLVHRFGRTVHHVDDFADSKLAALQARAITSADELFVVSRTWKDHLQEHFERDSTLVGNGVDTARFSTWPDGREEDLRRRLGLKPGPVFLSVGGVEERKNSLNILLAFAQVRLIKPQAQLIIAGGASVLDHQVYQKQFAATRGLCRLPPASIHLTGPLPQVDMPALYRIADTLVFPSLKEGFGLVVVEAMASGLPVVTSKIPPFTEYLDGEDAVWCDPHAVSSIADAMLVSLVEPMRSRLIARGYDVAARHDWSRAASAHLSAYEILRETEHA